MAENEAGSISGTVVSFMIGSIVGAGLALLFAPAAGQETRESLSSWIGEGRRKTRDYLAARREDVTKKTDQMSAAIDASKKAYLDPKNKGRNDQHEFHKDSAAIS
ncbi:MAG: YtxH domain-containing protein [Elusimicrobiota bacterium]